MRLSLLSRSKCQTSSYAGLVEQILHAAIANLARIILPSHSSHSKILLDASYPKNTVKSKFLQ